MNINQIAEHLGIRNAEFAKRIGLSPQHWGAYTSGRRGVDSSVITKAVKAAGLCQERIIFENILGSGWDDNRDSPEYWLSLILEATNEAERRNLSRDAATEIRTLIYEIKNWP